MPLKFWERPVRKSEGGKYGPKYENKPETDSDKRKADTFAGPGSTAGKLKEQRKAFQKGDARMGRPTVGGSYDPDVD